MRILFNLLLTFSFLSLTSSAFSEPKKIYDAVDAFTKKYVDPKNGRVDYLAISKNGTGDLSAILKEYETLDTKPAADKMKKALYINFYNMGMISNILRYAKDNKIDVSSKQFLDLKINDLKTPNGNIWNGSYKFKFNGENLTLDNIEHDLIRGNAKGKLAAYKVSELDPRIHAAVNCAAISCPRVREKAYRPETIDQMLDENLKATLGSEDQFKKLSETKARVNNIFSWYYSDFDETGKKNKQAGAGDFLAGFVPASAKDGEWLKAHLKKNFNDRSAVSLKLTPSFEFFYNWQINDKRN